MNKKVVSLLQYLFFLGLGLFLLWLTLRKSDWNTILADLRGAEYIYLIPAVLMLLASHYIRALRWKILMEPLGYNPSLTNTFLSVMVGYWANLAVPRLGEVLKCTILARYEKVPADKLVGTIVAERAIDVVSLLLILIITIFLQYDIIGEFTTNAFGNFFRSSSGGFPFASLAIFIGIIVIVIVLYRRFIRKINHLAVVIKIKKVLSGIWQGLISIKYIRNKGLFFLHSFLIWTLYLFSTYMGFFAMKELSAFGIKAAMSVLTFGSLGMIIPSPGGIGSYQYAVQQVMLLYGVSAEKGLSLGMLIWVAQTGFIIIAGTICFMLLPVLNKKKNETNRHHSVENSGSAKS